MAWPVSDRMFYRGLLAPPPQQLDGVLSLGLSNKSVLGGLGLDAGGAGHCLELVPPTNRGMEGFLEEGSFEGDPFRAWGWEEGTHDHRLCSVSRGHS